MHGEFLIMRPLGCKTIPDHVPATQNALGLLVPVGFSQPLPRGFVDSGSGGSESHCNTRMVKKLIQPCGIQMRERCEQFPKQVLFYVRTAQGDDNLGFPHSKPTDSVSAALSP